MCRCRIARGEVLTTTQAETTEWKRALHGGLTLFRYLFQHWRVALFMACFLHLSTVKTLLTPLETGAHIWALLVERLSAPSGEVPLMKQPYSVVLISPERFETVYAGRRPLSRQALLADLRQLGSATVALDIDISPMPRYKTTTGSDDQVSQDELALYGYIKATPDKFLLILPFPVQDEANRKIKADWLLDMCRAGVNFADPRIELNFGVVTQELPHADLSFAHLVRQIATQDARAGEVQPLHALCNYIRTGNQLSEQGGSNKPSLGKSDAPATEEQFVRAANLLRPELADRELDHLAQQQCGYAGKKDCKEQRLLLFGKGQTSFTQFSWCPGGGPFEYSNCGAHAEKSTRQGASVVILGGAYDLADRFSTPVGEKTGAYLHGISAYTTSVRNSHLGALLADFALGLIFGLVAHGFWGLWFDTRRDSVTFFKGRLWQFTIRPQTSWLVLAALIVVMAILTVLALLVSIWLLKRGDLWLSPIPLVIGMTLDAMLLGSTGAATHKMDGHHAQGEPPATATQDVLKALIVRTHRWTWIRVVRYVPIPDKAGLVESILMLVPQLIWWGVVVYVLITTVFHH